MGLFGNLFRGSDVEPQPWDYMDASGTLDEREAEAKARDERFSEALHAACQ